MRERILASTLAAMGGALCLTAVAAPTATLLYAHQEARVIGVDGATRPARQGEAVQAGERLLTPADGITQIRLPDGSLVGMRPGSELKIDYAPARPDGRQDLTLVDGKVRVISAELVDEGRSSDIGLHTGTTTLEITAADLELAVVGPDGDVSAHDLNAGSYSRLLTGAGVLNIDGMRTPLEPRQVGFVPPGAVHPIVLNAPPPELFAPSRSGAAAAVAAAVTPVGMNHSMLAVGDGSASALRNPVLNLPGSTPARPPAPVPAGSRPAVPIVVVAPPRPPVVPIAPPRPPVVPAPPVAPPVLPVPGPKPIVCIPNPNPVRPSICR